jgi:hypothetical protein
MLIRRIPAVSTRLSILFSKIDQTCHRRVLFHYRQEVQVSACIVRELKGWISYTMDWLGMAATDLTWTVPGQPPFTYETITLVMKAVCDLLGLPAGKISTHSLRYGGASTLGMAGYPKYIIVYMVRGSLRNLATCRPADEVPQLRRPEACREGMLSTRL